MYDVVIIHGAFGSPYINWFPWLYKELVSKGKKVLVPHFPTPTGQTVENWMSVLNAYDEFIGENTTLIAHSIAPAFVVNYLIKSDKKVNGFIAVAPVYGLIGIQAFDNINSSFFAQNIKIEDAIKYTNYIDCIYSDNDPYIALELSEDFATRLSANKTIIKDAGHLDKDAGYVKFKLLIDILEKH